MKLVFEDEKDRFFYEHANIRSKDTKQPFDLWVDEHGCDRNVQHNEPRFKVTANNIQLDLILHKDDSIEIVNSSSDIRKFKHSKEAVNFIDKFKEPLRAHWNHDLTTYELTHILRKVYGSDKEILDVLSDVITNGISKED